MLSASKLLANVMSAVNCSCIIRQSAFRKKHNAAQRGCGTLEEDFVSDMAACKSSSRASGIQAMAKMNGELPGGPFVCLGFNTRLIPLTLPATISDMSDWHGICYPS